MKKLRYTRKGLLSLSIITTMLIMAACDNTRESKEIKEIAENNNAAKFQGNNIKNDTQFLINATEIALDEIKLGQLAQQNGSTPEVKELGKMMEEAYSKLLNDLNALAKSKMMAIPTSSTANMQETYTDFSKKSGNDFDKIYSDIMVSEHQYAIEFFEDASIESNDAEIKKWATVSVPILRKHLDYSINCQNKVSTYNSPHN